MRRPLLIVNADDLGRTPGINEGIFTAHRDGVVTSATMMVGFAAAAEAAAALGDHPDLGVGLHVTLSGAAPTLPLERVSHLVDGEGRLPRRPETATGPIAAADPAAADAEVAAALDEVRAEVRHQLDRFRELTGRLPSHLDSHHHSHRLPLVLQVLVEVALEHGLPVRNTSPAVGRRLRREAVATTDLFIEDFYGERTGVADLLALAAQARRRLDGAAGAVGSTELMCHPARVDAPLAAASTYTAERERELATLTDPAVRHALEDQGWVLGHFGHLAQRASATAAPAHRGTL